MKGSDLKFINKYWGVIVFSIALIVLHKPITAFLNHYIVNPILGDIDSIWYNDLIVSSAILYVVYITYKRRGKYNPSGRFTLIMTMVSLFYLYYRFLSNTWDFTEVSFVSYFKYADLLLFVSVSSVYLYFKKKDESFPSNDKGFFEDKPITNIDEDDLGFKKYANQLSKKIIESNFENSLAIGINGKWGSGKSSMLNLIKDKIKDKDVIEVDFNPWASNNPNSIIEDFFKVLQNALTPYHPSLTRSLMNYSNRIINANSGIVKEAVEAFVFAVNGSNSAKELLDDINGALKEIGKKLVIYIDDIDRLEESEITEVLRLIRNTANFHNTVYIVTYDRAYVVSALHKYNSHNNEFFLEKIFQLEISLPIFKKDILRKELAAKLISRLPEKKGKYNLHDIINKEVIGDISNNPEFLDDWLENMRDVSRLANSIILNYIDLIGEVNFNDLLRIELLRVKYTKVYDLIGIDTQKFFDSGPNFENMHAEHRMDLMPVSRLKDEKGIVLETSFSSYFEYYTNEYYKELLIPHSELIKVNKFVSEIFSDNAGNRDKLSIIHPRKFNRYFAYRLFSDSLSEVEFSDACDLDQSGFNSKLSEWLSEGMESELKSQFYDIITFDSREDYEKIIRAIFYIANWKKDSASRYIGFDFQIVYEKLSLLISSNYYSDKDDLKTFIKDVFNSAKSPYLFESNVLRYLVNLSGVHDHLPLSDEEFNEISINYLEKYIKSVSKFDENIGDLFENCKMATWIDTGTDDGPTPFPYPPKAVMLVKSFIFEKDINGFINTVVYEDSTSVNKYRISPLFHELFGSPPNLEEEFSEYSDGENPLIKSFLEFYKKSFLVSFMYGVDFDYIRQKNT